MRKFMGIAVLCAATAYGVLWLEQHRSPVTCEVCGGTMSPMPNFPAIFRCDQCSHAVDTQ